MAAQLARPISIVELPHQSRPALFGLLSLLLCDGSVLHAQVPSERTQRDPPERVWVSLGVGAGTGATLAGVLSGQAVVNARILGLTLGTFGALGPRRVSYAGIALSVALGWFGK